MRLFCILILCISFIQGSAGLLLADNVDKNYKLIFSTFDDKSAGKYAYLRDSIQTMLMSRLSASENVEVIDRVLNKKELTDLAQKTFEVQTTSMDKADYVVTGGIYALSGGINVQVAMYPFNPDQKVLNFSKISHEASDIISDNDVLIASILKELLGDDATQVEGVVDTDNSVSGFTTAHPEAEYKKELYSGTIVESELHGIEAKANGIKRTLSVDGEIITFAVGDLDGNGIEEIVSLTSSTLNIYQTKERNIIKIAEMQLPPALRVHGLNVADITKNGKLEICISATEDLQVASRIVVWGADMGFKTLSKDVRWYLRPIYTKAEGWLLAGQKRGQKKIDFVGKGLFWLDLDKDYKVSEKSRLPIPDGINLFDFAYANLDGVEGDELVVLDKDEKLRVFSSDNQLLWVSSSTFGGSKTYIGPSQGTAVDKQSRTNLSIDEDADRDLVFVPARILVTDVDNDGLSEVVVNENKSGALGIFKRLRSYDGGTVVGLAWNGSELTEAWRTGRYKGYVVDYFYQITARAQSADSTSSSVKTPTESGRLYVANMPLSGTIVGLLPGMSDTKLTVYELDFYKQKQSDNDE